MLMSLGRSCQCKQPFLTTRYHLCSIWLEAAIDWRTSLSQSLQLVGCKNERWWLSRILLLTIGGWRQISSTREPQNDILLDSSEHRCQGDDWLPMSLLSFLCSFRLFNLVMRKWYGTNVFCLSQTLWESHHCRCLYHHQALILEGFNSQLYLSRDPKKEKDKEASG